ERLEGGARLTPRLRDAVELRKRVIASAHQGADVAGVRVEGDEEAFQAFFRIAVALFDGEAPELPGLGGLDLARQFLFRRPLQPRVQRSPHPETLCLGVLPETVVELAPDGGHEPGGTALLFLRAQPQLA